MPARTRILGFKAAAVAFAAAVLAACYGARQEVSAPTTVSGPPIADLYDPWVPDDPYPPDTLARRPLRRMRRPDAGRRHA